MSHPIFLVAGREIAVRFRSRAFRVTTAITAIGLVGFVAFAAFRGGQSHEYEVVRTPDVSNATLVRLGALGEALNAEVRAGELETREAVVEAVRSGEVDLGIVGSGEIVVDRGLAVGDTSPRARFLAAAAEVVRTQRGLEAAGLTPEAAAAALSAPPPTLTALKPAPTELRGRAVAFVGILLLFMMINGYGTWISASVVREKTSRLSELLLVTLKPRHLLMGKLLGVATLAFGHAISLGLIGLLARTVLGGNVLRAFNLNVASVLWPLAWFIVGFALFASLYAAAGSMVRNPEDSTAFPLFAILLVGYFSASTLISGGEASTYHYVLAWFPLTAPFNMLGLIGIGAVPLWQALASFGVALVSVPLVILLASNIYATAVSRTGQKVKWTEVLRPGGLRRTPA